MDKPTVRELLDANPEADADLLDEALRVAESLKDSGFSGSRYRLATPISRAEDRERRGNTIRESHPNHRVVRRF